MIYRFKAILIKIPTAVLQKWKSQFHNLFGIARSPE